MKFLIDVCVGKAVAEDLIRSGHDVIQVRDIDTAMGDAEILDRAQQEQRILITLDKDFGALIFHRGLSHAGLVRLPDVRRKKRVAIVRKVLDRHGEDLEAGAVVTVTKRLIRTRKAAEDEK